MLDHLLLGSAVQGQLLLLLSLVSPVCPSPIRPPPLLQGGRGFLFRWRVVSQFPTAHLAVIQPALPGAISLVLDQKQQMELRLMSVNL